MIKRKYYALVAGLPDLSVEEQKLPCNVKGFRDETYQQLSKKDKKLFNLFFLKFDNKNLISYLNDKDAVLDDRGSYSKEDFGELITLFKEVDNPKDPRFPSYFFTFLSYFFQEDNVSHKIFDADYLSALYYNYALKCGNSFVRDWFQLNLNLNNLLVALVCRKYKYPVADYIVGEGEIAKALRSSSARDFGLSGSFEEFDKIISIAEESDLLERERKIDLLKWQWIEEHVFFHYFTIEKLFSHLLMLDILERWTLLDKECGRENFRNMVATMKSSLSKEE
ncbi:MAG: DUF2764 family protein [Bacteroidales bacterium]|nr:DUF2764 family protein [Bacteroidales bacterium]